MLKLPWRPDSGGHRERTQFLRTRKSLQMMMEEYFPENKRTQPARLWIEGRFCPTFGSGFSEVATMHTRQANMPIEHACKTGKVGLHVCT